MKLQPLRSVPQHVYVALSGGVDSIAVAYHLLRTKKLKAALWFNHNDAVAPREYAVVREFCDKNSLELHVGDASLVDVNFSTSKEKYWSDLRNTWFNQFDAPVITGHNLDDVVEYYLMTAFQGEGHYTHYRNKNVYRSYLTTPKTHLVEYAIEHNLQWFEDPTNGDVDFTPRNRIRHCILPEVLKVNPGLYNTIKRRVIERTTIEN